MKLRQSLFQLLNLSIIEAVFLSSSNPTVDLFTLRYVQVSLWIFVGLLLVYYLLPELFSLGQDFLNHGFVSEYWKLLNLTFKVED